MIGAEVELGAGCKVDSHAVLKGPLRMGSNNRVFPFCVLGEDTPDLKYAGEEASLIIGNDNTFREGVVIHRGTTQGGGETIIGSDCLLMAYSHIAHDARVGDHVVMTNYSAIAGHVVVMDYAILGGAAIVHQHCTIGAHSMLGLGAIVTKDVPAFMVADGKNQLCGINAEGMRRRGMKDDISTMRKAYRTLYHNNLGVEQACAKLEQLAGDCQPVKVLLESVCASQRGILRPRQDTLAAEE